MIQLSFANFLFISSLQPSCTPVNWSLHLLLFQHCEGWWCSHFDLSSQQINLLSKQLEVRWSILKVRIQLTSTIHISGYLCRPCFGFKSSVRSVVIKYDRQTFMFLSGWLKVIVFWARTFFFLGQNFKCALPCFITTFNSIAIPIYLSYTCGFVLQMLTWGQAKQNCKLYLLYISILKDQFTPKWKKKKKIWLFTHLHADGKSHEFSWQRFSNLQNN